ncbi:insulinase family protein [Geitlerinema sp. P-1104]|uniref:M16 family metallopeptidase n=1 Tax=Geitlerinema sp. P-1104 TaxID=2546230 RepID=UPI0014773445|nr:pitrilysin family protein [Geitlerinema sp. P-1104]NMG59352.1 insulinase family protein [Geitlerinema sp. P-1104]
MSEPSQIPFWKHLRPYLALLFLVGLLISQLLQAPPSVAATPQHYSELEFPPLPEVQLPEYEQFQLDNGLKVYLIEEHTLPLVSGVGLIQTGSRLEPADKVGLASLTGALMRAGGTVSHPPDVLNRQLEQKAASVEASIGTSNGTVRFDALSSDLDGVFSLFVEVLREPAFEPQQFALLKNQARGNIARRNDEPRSIANREFQKLIYGEQSPYARTMEYETLDGIEREDVQGFYQDSVQPDRLILGLVGDFDSTQMKGLIEQKLGDWQATASSLGDPSSSWSEIAQAETGGLFMVDRPELSQSYVELGHLGGVRNDPDYPVLGVMNNVLSGFGGRLFNEVRSRQGLAYSVYGFWGAQYDYPGVFRAGGQTRSEATVPFIEAVRQELDQIRREPITPEELQFAQDSTLNSFVFNFASRAQTLSRLLTYDYYDYPTDFLFRYQDGVRETTVEDVLRVAQTYLNPEQLVTLVVGNRAAIDPPLDAIAPQNDVTLIDVTIPEPS